MKKIASLSMLLLLVAAPVYAQALPADSLFDRMIGHWVLRGTIARQATTHDVTFDWVLGHEYVQMHEVSRERVANGAPAYEAVVLFGRDPRTAAGRSATREPLCRPCYGGSEFVVEDPNGYLLVFSEADESQR